MSEPQGAGVGVLLGALRLGTESVISLHTSATIAEVELPLEAVDKSTR
jgi:hypothetical protein